MSKSLIPVGLDPDNDADPRGLMFREQGYGLEIDRFHMHVDIPLISVRPCVMPARPACGRRP